MTRHEFQTSALNFTKDKSYILEMISFGPEVV